MLKYIKQYAASIEGINIYPLFSLFVFVLFFIAVIVYVRKMDKHNVDTMKHLPLELDNDNTTTSHPLKQA